MNKQLTALTLGMAMFAQMPATLAEDISIQSRFPPLQFKDATPGGAHPVGGAAKNFIDQANVLLAGHDINLKMHLSGKINPADEGTVEKPIVNRKEAKGLLNAVVKGSKDGGITAYMGLPTTSKMSFAEFYAGGFPFGLTVSEWFGFLYAGGGLELHQKFYDQKYDGKVKVIPVAVSPSQTSGFFPNLIPTSQSGKTAEQALVEFCNTPIILRYPIGARYILDESCKSVGAGTDFIGKNTRCEDPKAPCGANHADNKIVNEPKRLTFGGFAPGVFPHAMYANGNVDAFELAMPSGHLQFFKLVSKKQNEANDTVDVSSIIPPYHYLTSWHQTWVMTELVWNKSEWDTLPKKVQIAIETVAKASVLTTYSQRLSAQGEALNYLEKNGTKNLPWPEEMIDIMRKNSDKALDRLAADEEAKGDASFKEVLAAMRAYKAKNAAFFDADDVSQGTTIR